MKFKLLIVLLLASAAHLPAAGQKPNIIFITSEDNDYHWLGCYGNKKAQTPRLDALAEKSILFTHAYSNAPVCAVARSTIINGAYAVTQGTQHMRSRHQIPDIKSYTHFLQKQGYFCTNRSKTDFNFAGKDQSLWDECSRKAHYKHRPKGSPFFAVFNSTTPHESSLFVEKITDRRKRGVIPKQPRTDPSKVELRPYLPDLPEIRSDIAIYHDTMTAFDTEVGNILDQLEKDDLAEDSIIFYYSDHGGVTPRGKRYLKDSGVRVPMIVHIPKKWQHLSPFKPGQKVNELVSFVDLAPTLLSLANFETPGSMQGRAFLGQLRIVPPEDDFVFLYADRFDEFYGMRRGITDGRWKYIRRFTPHLAAAPYSTYQFRQAGWRAWQQAWKDGTLKGRHRSIWEGNQPVEELYDTQADQWEVQNLANVPEHAKRLSSMRNRLRQKMIDVLDTGIIPEPMFHELAPRGPIANYSRAHAAELPAIIDLAFAASARNPENLALFIENLKSKNPLLRYWATQGCLILGKKAATAKSEIIPLLKDQHSAIRVAAAQSIANYGAKELAVTTLLAELDPNTNEYAQQNAMNALTHLEATNGVPDSWVKASLSNKNAGKYVKRFAESLAEKRK